MREVEFDIGEAEDIHADDDVCIRGGRGPVLSGDKDSVPTKVAGADLDVVHRDIIDRTLAADAVEMSVGQLHRPEPEPSCRRLQDRGALGARVDHHRHAPAVDLTVDQRLTGNHLDLEFSEPVEFALGLRGERRGGDAEPQGDRTKS